MQDLLRWLLSLKGVEVEPGSELHVELTAFPSGGLGLLVLLGCVAAIAFVVARYRREARDLSPRRRAVLWALRGLALLLVVALVLEPDVVAVKREVRPGHTLLLLDVSQSMQQKDAFRQAGVQELAQGWRTVGIDDPAAQTRAQLAKALLARNDQELVRTLAARNRVLPYVFAAGLEPLPLLAPPESRPGDDAGANQSSAAGQLPPPPRLDVAAIAAEGRYTNPGGAVRAALERSRDAAIAGVVVLSDGRRNMGPQAAEIARLLAQRHVPRTLVFGIGDPSETQVVELARFDAPEKVFQKDPFGVKAVVTGQGYDDVPVSVRLVRVPPGGGSGTVVDTKQVRVRGRAEVAVEWHNLVAEAPGTYTYRAEIEPPAGEPPAPERHSKQAQIEVLGEQLRVLLISGGPTHEYRILRDTLVRDKTIEVACWLTSADPDFPQDGDVELKALPIDRKELESWDVLLLLDPDPSKLTRDFSTLVAQHVSEDGAGLWWVCGEKYTLDALRVTAPTQPVAELLPVVPDLETADYKVIGYAHSFTVAWPWALQPSGTTHNVTRLVKGSKDENALLWERLPGFYWAFPVLRPKPAAQVLVAHPSPKLRRPEGPMPLLAAQFVGSGRVLFSATDESYRWRTIFKEGYERLWVNGLRWLFEGRMTAGNTRFRLHVSEAKVELGDTVRLLVEARDEAYQPLVAEAIELTIRKDDGAPSTIRLDAVEGGQFETVLRPSETGFYRIAAKTAGKPVEATFQVVPAAIEKEGPVDLAFLDALAGADGGERCNTPQQLLDACKRIPSLTATDVFRTPHPIWDTWATVLLLSLVLGAEWWLRKKVNLL